MTQEYEALAARLVRGIDEYSYHGIVATKAGLCREAAAAIRALVAENERLRARLEIPAAPFEAYDGIHCRDETIKQLDANVAALRAHLIKDQADGE